MDNIMIAIVSAAAATIPSFAGGYFIFRGKKQSSADLFAANLMDQVLKLNSEITSMKKDYNLLMEQNILLNQHLNEYKNKVAELEMKISEQFNHIEIIEAYYENMPGPAWMKDTSGVMFFINSAYEKQFGVSKREYQQSTDVQVWGEEIGNAFWKNDMKVLRAKKGFVVQEWVPFKKDLILFKIWKFPIFIKDELIGCGGVCLEELDRKKNPDY